MMADGGGGFMEAVKARIDATLDACTRCGKCVEACPMVEPAGLDPANGGRDRRRDVIDLLAGGNGTPDAERWAQVCTNSGKCIPACDYGVNPRFMVNMARIAAMNLHKGEAEVRRGAQQYFNTMGRSTRTISRLQLSPEVLERVAPRCAPPSEYETPDIVFYTGCNVIKTPHIALLVLEVLDALGVSYEVMGGTATCCGIQQFKRGDAKTAGRVGFNTIERLARPGASKVVSWCPSCFIQIGEVALPAYEATVRHDAVRDRAARRAVRRAARRSAAAVRPPGREARRVAGALGGAEHHGRGQSRCCARSPALKSSSSTCRC